MCHIYDDLRCTVCEHLIKDCNCPKWEKENGEVY
jgi:hypothetical protein